MFARANSKVTGIFIQNTPIDTTGLTVGGEPLDPNFAHTATFDGNGGYTIERI